MDRKGEIPYMTRFFRICTGACLLALVFTIGIACAADGEGLNADLNISKVVSSTGPFEINDNVTWVVTLWNNGPGNATNITVAEDVSALNGRHDITAIASLGNYDTATNFWNIPELKNATSATLTLTTNFSSAGNKVNTVNITALDETDPNLTDNSAEATTEIQETEITPPQGPTADLAISKSVSSTGPYNLDDEVTWVVTLQNQGPANATNITVTEDVSGLTGLKDLNAIPSLGTYNTSTNLWNISELENTTSATLTLTTNFSTSGKKVNRVVITALNETDPNPDNNSAQATVQFNTTDIITPGSPKSGNLTIRPNTLNLKSNGVFTVYVTLSGFAEMAPDGNNKPRIDYDNSSLTCSGADMVRASESNKGGGTLIAKFHRQDLENVTADNGVQVNCSGTLSVNGETINVAGYNTIRVIEEKKGADKIFSQFLQLLGLEKNADEIAAADDINETTMVVLNSSEMKNFGQAKKTLRADNHQETASPGNVTVSSDKSPVVQEKGNPAKNNGNTNQVNGNNANNKSQKGNNSANERDDESTGKSNGKNK
jgi:uncharacterized repeat protein (TIGR01451 family)